VGITHERRDQRKKKNQSSELPGRPKRWADDLAERRKGNGQIWETLEQNGGGTATDNKCSGKHNSQGTDLRTQANEKKRICADEERKMGEEGK